MLQTTESSTNVTTFFNDEKPVFEPIYRPQAPNFMRLFILRRILKRFVKKNEKMKLLFKNCQLNNTYCEGRTQKIVSSLMKYGLKTYMTDHYSENRDSQTIDLIFEYIIFKHFDKEYHQIITYVDKSRLALKQGEKVFNTSDLICSIFQYAFGDTKDIENITLVCTQWFYHSFDKKSYRYCKATAALMKIAHFNPKKHPKHQLESFKSQLQRLYNVQTLNIELPRDFAATSPFLSHLAVFNNVETLVIKLTIRGRDIGATTQLHALRAITDSSCQELKSVTILTSTIDRYAAHPIKLVVLRLPNAEAIITHQCTFPIIFSNKLTSLTIGQFKYEDCKEWLEFTVNNCDCSNIKYFKVNQNGCVFTKARFGDKMTIEMMKKFAKKFVKLEKVEIVLKYGDDESTYLWSVFVKALQPLIEKNGIDISSTRPF